MIKLTKDQINENIDLNAKINPFLSEVRKLEIGEGLFIENKEWPFKTSVQSTAHTHWSVKLKMKFRTKRNIKGTYVIRIL